MDLLTDILRQAGLRRRLLDHRRLSDHTALQFPCERSMGLHVITAGPVYLHAPSIAQPLRLHAGDMALMARGCLHSISTHADLGATRPVRLAQSWPLAGADATDAAGAADAPTTSALISGAYQFWHNPVHPLFAEMPDWFILRTEEGPYPPGLTQSLDLLQQELTMGRLGSETLVYGVLDVIFVVLLREVLQRRGAAQACWSSGIQDPPVWKAVQALHNDCAHGWTLDALAQHAGLSRTSLAQRFRASMNNTPLHYLRTLRMQKAMALLSGSERSLEHIAQEVGYTDAFSFSKVFKRTLGMSPRDFRRQDQQEQSLQWRIG